MLNHFLKLVLFTYTSLILSPITFAGGNTVTSAIENKRPTIQQNQIKSSLNLLVKRSIAELQVETAYLIFDKDGQFNRIENSAGESIVRQGDQFTRRGIESPTMTLVNTLSEGFAANRPGILANDEDGPVWPQNRTEKEKEQHVAEIQSSGVIAPEKMNEFAESLPPFKSLVNNENENTETKDPTPKGQLNNGDSRTTGIAGTNEEGGEVDPQILNETPRGSTTNPGQDPGSNKKGTVVGPVGPGTFDPATDGPIIKKTGIIDANKLKEIKPGVIVDVR